MHPNINQISLFFGLEESFDSSKFPFCDICQLDGNFSFAYDSINENYQFPKSSITVHVTPFNNRYESIPEKRKPISKTVKRNNLVF